MHLIALHLALGNIILILNGGDTQMKELPKYIQDKVNTSLAIIRRKTPERKVLVIGVALCVFILLLLFLGGGETTNTGSGLFAKKEVIYSPVDGVVVELPLKTGVTAKRGDALLRFDPVHIRRQNSIVRDYLDFFKENIHNTGTLKQKFKPLFSEMFDELAVQRKVLMEKETNARDLYKTASLVHSKLQFQMRDSKNHDEEGLPNKELVEKEMQASIDIVKIREDLEKASLKRAAINRKMREITADLNQPHGMLYRHLEKQYAEVQTLLRNEYTYATSPIQMGRIFVKVGDHVKKGDPLYEVFPQKALQE